MLKGKWWSIKTFGFCSPMLPWLVLFFLGFVACQPVQDITGSSNSSASGPVVVLNTPASGQTVQGSVIVAGSILESGQVTSFFLYYVTTATAETNVLALSWGGGEVESFREEIFPASGNCQIWVEASDEEGNTGNSGVVSIVVESGTNASSQNSSNLSSVDSSSVSSVSSTESSQNSSNFASSQNSSINSSVDLSVSSSAFSSDSSSSSSFGSSSSAFSGIEVFVEKPATWAEIWIWFDEGSDDAWETATLKTAPGDLTEYRTGWFRKQFPGSSSVTFLFNDGSWVNKLDDNGGNFTTTASVWILSDGTSTNADPLGNPDTEAPVVNLSSPVGATVSGTVTVAATASDNTAVSKVEFLVDDVVVKTIATAPYEFSWDTLTVSGGDHVFKATAYDTSGNTSSDFVSVTVDNSGIAPAVSVSPAGGDFYGDGTTVNFSVLGDGVSVARYTTDGSDPSVSGISFTNHQSVTIGTGLTNGQSVILKIYAANSAGSDSTNYTYNRKEHQADPEKPYSLNLTFGKYRSSGIVIDGANTAGEWTSDMLIAIDMANDDPRSLGDNWTMHEAPIDYSHLWACWDDTYLYFAWQVVDVTDAIDPSNAGSGDVVFGNDGILQSIVLDTDPNAGATLDMWGKNNGEPYWGGNDLPDVQIYIASSLWQGYVSRAVTNVFPVDDGGTNYMSLTAANIDVAVAAGFYGPSLWGVLDADDATNYPGSITPVDMINTGKNGNTHQNTSRDGFYEMKIPLSFLGLTRSDLENKGIGIMVIGQGAMDTIPHDPASIDLPGVETYNSSFEWSDTDLLTSDFARIGHAK